MLRQEKHREGNIEVDVNLETTPILYADNVFINLNDFGIVFDIGQKVGNSNRVRIVSRIGMSREHAATFANELAKLLAITSLKQDKS